MLVAQENFTAVSYTLTDYYQQPKLYIYITQTAHSKKGKFNPKGDNFTQVLLVTLVTIIMSVMTQVAQENFTAVSSVKELSLGAPLSQ